MPKRNPPATNRFRNQESEQSVRARGPGGPSLLIFWPFHLLNLFTRRMRWPLKAAIRLAGYPALAGMYLLVVLSVIYGLRGSHYDLAKVHAMPERSIILDRLGEEIGRIHGERRSIVPLKDVAENFRKAILAREDERFYRHGPVDLIGIARAVFKNLGGKKEGASTITQQLASDIFKLKAGERRGETLKQLDRKMLEIAIAFRLEATYSKDQLLQAYINQINWGKSIKGVGEASRIYFEKHPAELTLSESALLAGIVRGPDAYNPFKSMEMAARERGTTLERMVAAGAITQAEADAAKLDDIEVRPVSRRNSSYSYAMEAVSRELEILLEKENLELGGLEITTTIDLRLQHKGEEALDKKLREVERYSGYPHQTRAAWRALPEDTRGDPEYLQGAAVIIENRTGAVLAVVGGRDAKESSFVRATRAVRPIGSIFKPFVYLAAFDQGLRPETPVSDGPLQPGEIEGAGRWRPKNSDGQFGGAQPAAMGLIRSRNTMSVRVGNYAGLEKVKEVANTAGFTTAIPDSPVSYLGSWGATPLEVASAYTIFPNEGKRCVPFLISQIKDRDGNVLYPKDANGRPVSPIVSYQAASSSSAWNVSRLLKEVATRGTAASVTRLGFTKPCGGKTGTTNDYKDAWFSGYSSTLTCTVWVGFDKPKKTIDRGYGSTLALPIWVDIMKTADRLDYKAGELHSKVNLVAVELCHLSGKRATAGCHAAGTAYADNIPADTVSPPEDTCPRHPARAVPVLDPDGALADAPSAPTPDPNIPAAIPLRAIPVDETENQDIPLRAIPVDE